MSAQHEFYRQRAEEARAGASNATLDNIRDRWLRSEASWTALAEQSEGSEAMRQKLLAEKVNERRVAEAATQGGIPGETSFETTHPDPGGETS